LGAEEDFLFYEESFHREGIGSKGRVFSSMKNHYREGIGSKEGFPLL
jgi:hypothetical protein